MIKNISGENIFIPFVKRKDPNVVKIQIHGKENFRREIISLHSTKGRVNYEEVREQFLHGVLEDETYINGNINGKWHRAPEHIREKSKYRKSDV